MNAGLVIAVLLAVAFAMTNGLHDAANSIAALVATREATPLQAIVLASVFNLLGPLLLGAAVANTIGGIVTVAPSAANEVIGAGLAAAVVWNLATWRRGLPSSSAQALVGGLVGAAVAEGGVGAVDWGGLRNGHPVGVFGTLISLAIAPPMGALVALLVIRGLRRMARRAARRWRTPVRSGQWTMAAALAFSHGANDAQKAVGVIAALLLANGRIGSLAASPTWVIVLCAIALTAGTAMGGWPIIRTVGHGIYRIHSMEGLASTAASTAVIFGGSVVGAPLSTSQVVASSVVGVGGGRSRWRHVHWEVVGYMVGGWAITLPVTGLLAAAALAVWRWLT
jgi:inorganic phosphate transporter, PiT family